MALPANKISGQISKDCNAYRVTPDDVQKVHREMFLGTKMMYIRTCSKMEQFFLRYIQGYIYTVPCFDSTSDS